MINLNYIKNWLALLALIMSCTSYAQTKGKNSVPIKGHQLYKQMKLVDQKEQDKKDRPIAKGRKIADRAADRIHYEYERTCNPYTGKVPENIKAREAEFVQSNKTLSFNSRMAQKISRKGWLSRGPFNVGGRTRALAIDKSNENVILAGGVSGGMWRSTNQGKSWKKTTRNFQNFSVTAIAQDPRTGHHDTWYMGGGERAIGNSASINAPSYTGAGVHKSQDGGRTWELLRTTADNSASVISAFDIINSIVVDPTNGDVYVATINGIHRSQNGGATFEEVLATKNGNNTEIAITSSGRLYAFVDSNEIDDPENQSPLTGILTSENGENWINISKEENVYDEEYARRSVFAINPSNENEIYILSYAPEFLGFDANKLYRYSANNPTKWENLTDKLPEKEGNIAGLELQGGYNMTIAVHPKNPNIILFGGTNLFRTTNRFKNKNAIDWIGGYSPKDDISVYPDHHPDQHALAFFPSKPNKVLSACDGGVFITYNIRANKSEEEPVNWTSLNRGYLTSQPYTVSFDPNAVENEDVMAGFQDNGTWFTDKFNPKASWVEELGGDGSYSAFADNGLTRYSSAQGGQIFRINYDANGEAQSFARIQPVSDGFSFINPFILDPIDDNIMYLPIGRQILRNSNLDELPVVSEDNQGLSLKNWALLNVVVASVTDPNSGRQLNRITALDISKFPVSDRLYYGTSRGHIFRLDHASLLTNEPVDVFTGKGLPESAFISNIMVDPANSDRVVVTFSNYEIPSVFYTEDAGDTWIDISGNLEQNRDGSGNGPSIRSASFLGNNDGIIVGTSSGLYFTRKVQAEHTVWRKENRNIGNGVVMQIRTRKDGFAAAAVHGSGVFTKLFRVRKQPENTLFVNEPISDINLSTEDQNTTVNFGNAFKEIDGRNIKVSVENPDPEFVQITKRGNRLFVTMKKANLAIPEYDKESQVVIRLVAKSEKQEVAQEFRIATRQPSIYEQFDPELGLFAGIRTTTYLDGSDAGISGPIIINSADDFTIPKGEKWIIERVQTMGLLDDPSDPFNTDMAEVVFYTNDNGIPGEIVYKSEPFKTRSGKTVGDLDLVLPSSVELEEGIYWISVHSVERSFFSGGSSPWVWGYQLAQPNDNSNFDAHIKDNTASFAPIEWSTYDEWVTDGQGNKAKKMFFLYGEIENSSVAKKSDNLVANNLMVFPNPSSSTFTFILPKIEGKKGLNSLASLKIVDISGKVIYENPQITSNFIWDAKHLASGIYFANIKGESLNKTFKLIKN